MDNLSLYALVLSFLTRNTEEKTVESRENSK